MKVIAQFISNKWSALIIIALMLLFSLAVYGDLPDDVPVKFDFEGDPINTMGA